MHPLAAHGFERFFEQGDAAADAAAVHFELRFPRSARADAAAEPGHLDAAAGKTREQVIQLRQLDLQLPFARPGVAGKDGKNHLRAVHHAAVGDLFDVALLRGRQLGIENEEVRACRSQPLANLIELPAPDQCRGVETFPALHDRFFDHGPGGAGQLGKLAQGILGGGRNGSRRIGSERAERDRTAADRGFYADSHQDGAFSGTGSGNR